MAFKGFDVLGFLSRCRCGHGAGLLSSGDIEELGSCALGTRLDGSKQAGLCVRCPKHRAKFAGGLWFSLVDGRSFVDGYSEEWTEEFQVWEARLLSL